MEHRKGCGAQTPEGCIVVEVTHERNDAVGPQPGSIRSTSGEAHEPDPAAQSKCGTQRNVTASDQQYPDHVLASLAVPATRTLRNDAKDYHKAQ